MLGVLTISGIRITRVRQTLSKDCERVICEIIPLIAIRSTFVETAKRIHGRESVAIDLRIGLFGDDSISEDALCRLGAQLTELLNRVAHERPNPFIEGVGVEIRIDKLVYSQSSLIFPT